MPTEHDADRAAFSASHTDESFFSVAARAASSRFLEGTGLEIGPGRNVFPLGPRVAGIRYVEKPLAGGYAMAHGFPSGLGVPDQDSTIILDVDAVGFGATLERQDFLIASHVIEHLASPLAFLAECYRVLRPGGVLLLVVPDKRLTFDAPREPTTLEHVRRELLDGVDTVSRQHIVEFASAVGRIHHEDELTEDAEAHLRAISVHAHCWTWWTFLGHVCWLDGTGRTAWSLLDLSLPDLATSVTNEFVVALKRLPSTSPHALHTEILSWLACTSIDHELLEDAARSLVEAAAAQSGAPGPDVVLDTGYFALWDLWRRRPDLTERFPDPVEDAAPMVNWCVQAEGVEPDAHEALGLLAAGLGSGDSASTR